MQFPSLEYLIFFPLAVAAWYAAAPRLRWAVLIGAGAAFLALASPTHFAFAFVLSLVNYFAGLALERWAETRKALWVLLATLAFDVGVLGLFKYGNAVLAGFAQLEALFGVAAPPRVLSLVLPLGISYYSFQLIGYLLEVYWGRQPAARHLGHFAATILFFPKLVAGPIERPHHFLAQLAAPKPFDPADVTAGLKLLGWGLFKKCVIADRIAFVIGPIFGHPRDFSGLPLAAAIALYTVQVYCDFSGYTDVALGSARVLGLELAPNFNHPFSARSVTDFWRRWHISLSSWTNDYIYRPLSMVISFHTSWRRVGTVFSILVTFGVLGLWHGATWNFVLFGLLHGAAVSVEALTSRARTRLLGRLPARVADRLNNVVTVVFYSLSCVLFRANSISDALYILGHAFVGIGHAAPIGAKRMFGRQYHILLLGLVFGALVLGRWWTRRRPVAARPTWQRWPVYYAVIAAIVILGLFQVNQFVYVQF